LTSGIPEAIVREWVGHVDRETIRIYTHIARAQSREALDRLFPRSNATKAAENESGG
jgi:site-specific recombinase XerD